MVAPYRFAAKNPEPLYSVRICSNTFTATSTNFTTSIQAAAQMDVQLGAGSSACNLNGN